MKRKPLQNYRVTSMDGEENIYDAVMQFNEQMVIFNISKNGKFYKSIIYGAQNVWKIETITHPNDGEDGGAIIVPHRQFREFSMSIEAFDRYINRDDPDDYDQAS